VRPAAATGGLVSAGERWQASVADAFGNAAGLARGTHGPSVLAVEFGVVATWAAVLAVDAMTIPSGAGRSTSSAWWCAVGMGGMSSSRGGPQGVAQVTAGLPMWTLMSAAMMLPSALPAVRHVALNSLAWRRRRATLEFVTVYLATWVGYGAVVLTVLAVQRPTAEILVAALAVAVGWQLTGLKSRALRECHRSIPLPIHGWRATAGVARFAMHNGFACLGSCWAIMLVMTVSRSAQPAWMLGLTAVVYAEKASNRPRRAIRRTAALLGVAMLGFILETLVS
jgi:predicted metal-binding membrane protein